MFVQAQIKSMKEVVVLFCQGRLTLESGFSVMIACSAFDFYGSKDVRILYLFILSLFGYIAVFSNKQFALFKHKKLDQKLTDLARNLKGSLDKIAESPEDMAKMKQSLRSANAALKTQIEKMNKKLESKDGDAIKTGHIEGAI